MNATINRQVLGLLDDPSAVLVFPSEIVARYWRLQAISAATRRALSAERMISWDAFKESAFAIRSDRIPVNSTMRRIFAARLLRQNRELPFLRAVVDPAHSGNSAAFAGMVQRALPGLKALSERGALRRSDQPLLEDLAAIYDRYREFLAMQGLFEPGWLDAGIQQPPTPHVIVYPELIADYAPFAAELARQQNVTTLSPQAAASDTVIEHQNAHLEIGSVLLQVEALLDSGVDAAAIAITVAELDAYEPFLKRYADTHAIPLLFRRGRPLSDYGAGRFFRSLSGVVSDDFAFNSLRGLLLDAATPWLEPESGRALIGAAVAGGCLKRRLGTADRGDQWLRTIAASNGASSSGSGRAALRNFYLSLRDSLIEISSARGAVELRSRLIVFLRRFLDGDCWDPENLRVFQRALDELKQLAAAETVLGSRLEDPYALWLGLLEQTIYVPRAEQAGVEVFPYRVAAGIRPAYHFVLNASHDGTRVLESPFSFVREDLRERLALPEQDLSDVFLRAYQISGETVQFSYSTHSFAGPRFAAGRLAQHALRAASEPGDPSIANAAERDEAAYRGSPDPYRVERDLWAAGLAGLPPGLYPAQSYGIAHQGRTSFRERGVDLSRGAIAAGSLRDRILQRSTARDNEGLLALSASRIDSYLSCPFGHLLQHPLRIEEPVFTVEAQPAMAVGNYQHAVLDSLYRRIAQQDPLVRPEQAESYRKILDELLADQALQRATLQSVPRPVVAIIQRRTAEGIRQLLRAELEQLGPHRIECTELSASRLFDQAGVMLSGRIDRVSRHPGDDSYILVDYKRRGSAGRGQVVGTEGDPTAITTVQLPVYILLLEQHGTPVERAYYYLVERGEIVSIIDPDSPRHRLNAEQKTALLEHMVRLIDTVAAGLRAGDYRFPDPVSGCDGCRFRGICRAGFSVE